MIPAVALVGLPGAGKSAVGRALAERLRRAFVDVDEKIERETGRPITSIFAEEGEGHFRELERAACAALLLERDLVCAFGGGAITCDRTRNRWLRAATVVWLDAPPAVCAARVRASHDRPVVGEDPVASLTELLVRRGAAYRAAHLRVNAEQGIDEIVDELAPSLEAIARLRARGRTDTVLTPVGAYPIYLRPGALDEVADVLSGIGVRSGSVLVVTQAPLRDRAERLRASLEAAGYRPTVREVPQGEAAKTLEVASALFADCADIELTREGAVLALGGGTVGDLAGWVAASFKRGVPLVQLPTTLLSIVDSSVGGKVAINLPAGKNLVGAFYPPRAVVVDPDVLASLPAEERSAGMAEAVKHALLGDPGLLEVLAARPDSVMTLSRAIAVKRRVVELDPKERGLRMTLNLGHTFAHALERVSDYTLRHGHAVSIGLIAALALSEEVAGLDPEIRPATEAHLRRLGCPVRTAGDVDALMGAMSNDKKAGPRGLRFVVLNAPGDARVVEGVDPLAVRRAWAHVLESE